jgi:transposase InsO family protein
MYRILKKNKQLKHRSATSPKLIQRPKAVIAIRPNQVYSWDITYLLSSIRCRFFYLYMYVDIYSRKIVGYEVYTEESSNHAANLLEATCVQEKIKKNELILHSDNGSPMKGATMLATLQRLGVIPSFSRPGVSDDNPYSEALFKTLKYNPKYPLKPFESLEEARRWVDDFVQWYNYEHLHSGIKFVTPEQRHTGQDDMILKNRAEVYTKAKERMPQRFSNGTRNWKKDYEVLLNPEKGKSLTKEFKAVV